MTMRRTASILALVAFTALGCGTVGNDLDDGGAGAGGAAGSAGKGGVGGAGRGGTGGRSPVDCVFQGQSYPVGSTFSDGCNTCSCTTDGVACTARACPPVGGSGGNPGAGGAAGGPSKGGSGGTAGAGGVAGGPSKG